MSTTLKVYFSLPSGKQEIRRFTTNERLVLPALMAFLNETYSRHFTPPLRFVLQYDDGEDLCSVSSEAEMQEGLALHAASGAGGALKLLAAFDTAPLQQSVEPASGLSTPSVLASISAPISSNNFPASPSASTSGVAIVQEENSDDVEVVSEHSDSEYERVGEDESPQPAKVNEAKVVKEASPEPTKASAPEPPTSTSAAVEVEDEEAMLASAIAASMSAPTVEEDEAAPSPEVRIEDVSFSSVPVTYESASVSGSSTGKVSSESTPVIHHGITCDGCGTSPIIGTRFNCITCGPARGGFDLCQRCEEAGDMHPKEHQFRVCMSAVERHPQPEEEETPAETPDPMAVLHRAVQRVVGSLSDAAHAEEAGETSSGMQPIEVIQESVGEVLSAFRQAGQARRAAQAKAEAEAQMKAGASCSSSSQSPVVHRGVTCDGCGQSPIVGARYKCKDCTVAGGFDLCSKCEDEGFTKGEHTASHVLIKFKQEAHGSASGCWRRGGGMGGWHGRQGGWHGHHGGPHGHHQPPPHAPFMGALGPLGGMLGDLFSGRGGHHGMRGWGGRGRCTRFDQKPEVERPRAQFISDVTLADGLQVHAGEKLTKIWSVKNIGTSPWPVGTRLVFVGGDLTPESEGLWGPDATGALVPYAGPGDIVHVSIDVLVPNESGRFRCTFRLQTAEGERFGPRVWIDLRVPEVKVEIPVTKKSEEPAKPKEEPAVPSPKAAAPTPVEVKQPVAQVVAPTPAALPVAIPVAQQVRPQVIPSAKAVESKQADEEATLADEFRAAHVSPKPTVSAAPVAAGASSSAAPPASSRPPFQYANELAYLAAMGFTDKALCKYLLLNNQGDLTKAVQWLLQNAKSA
jgi:hypothetical protein